MPSKAWFKCPEFPEMCVVAVGDSVELDAYRVPHKKSGKFAQFVNGLYATDDPQVIAGIKECESFKTGKIVEVTEQEFLGTPSKRPSLVQGATTTVNAVQAEPPAEVEKPAMPAARVPQRRKVASK